MVGNFKKLAKVIKDTSESRKLRAEIGEKRAEILQAIEKNGRYELDGPKGRKIILTALPKEESSGIQATE